MSLTSIANDIKEHIESGEQWFTKVLAEHVPALIAEAERVQANPVVQALEAALLPPELEAEVVKVIGAFAAVVKSAAPAAPAEPAEPAAPADQAPADQADEHSAG